MSKGLINIGNMSYLKILAIKTITGYRRMMASRMQKKDKRRFTPLTSAEKEEVKKLWKINSGGGGRLKIYFTGFRKYKTVTGQFDAQYCPNDMFEPYIVRALNMPVHVLGFEHKAMLDRVFSGMHMPAVVCKCVNGVVYDKEMHIINQNQMFELVKGYDAVCVKKTYFSARGCGVRRLDCGNLTAEELREFLVEFGENYIIQEILKQSPKLSKLSKNSLNTFRISTLYINGECSVCTIISRIGRRDSFVDNGFAGNIFVGVDENGTYCPVGYDVEFNEYEQTDTGVVFSGFKIDEIKELVNYARDSHIKYLPLCGFCGWDFALDEKDEWTLVEVNLYAPGIDIEQIGPHQPLFGNRTKEVIDYVNVHRPSATAIMTSIGI